jgi:hypothetical protein
MSPADEVKAGTVASLVILISLAEFIKRNNPHRILLQHQ